MASNVLSENIEIFPIAKRRANDTVGNRVLTEDKISNIVRQLMLSTGFIVSYSKKESNLFDIEFNLYGYNFKIVNLVPGEYSSGNSLYAYIELHAGEIVGQDVPGAQDKNYYTGLTLSVSAPNAISENGHPTKHIKLFEKVSDEWQIVKSNFGLVSTLAIGGVDGKHRG